MYLPAVLECLLRLFLFNFFSTINRCVSFVSGISKEASAPRCTRRQYNRRIGGIFSNTIVRTTNVIRWQCQCGQFTITISAVIATIECIRSVSQTNAARHQLTENISHPSKHRLRETSVSDQRNATPSVVETGPAIGRCGATIEGTKWLTVEIVQRLERRTVVGETAKGGDQTEIGCGCGWWIAFDWYFIKKRRQKKYDCACAGIYIFVRNLRKFFFFIIIVIPWSFVLLYYLHQSQTDTLLWMEYIFYIKINIRPWLFFNSKSTTQIQLYVWQGSVCASVPVVSNVPNPNSCYTRVVNQAFFELIFSFVFIFRVISKR